MKRSPRIMFTPSPALLEALERLSEASGHPLARIVSEQLEDLLEHLHGLASVMEEYETMTREAGEAVRAAGEGARETIRPAFEEAKAAIDNLVLVASSGKPPSSNTGVTSSEYQGKLFSRRRR